MEKKKPRKISPEEQEQKNYHLRFRVALAVIAFLILTGTVVFREVENWNWVDSFYFTVATSATVGYGDVTPHTGLGRILAALYILLMVPIILYSFTVVGEMHFSSRYKSALKKKQDRYRLQHPEIIIEEKRLEIEDDRG